MDPSPGILKEPKTCFNCGDYSYHVSRECPNQDQNYTRCPIASCNVVARSSAAHRLHCNNKSFVSVKIGDYELPLMPFHNVCLTFNDTSQIFVEEQTTQGKKQFLVTKYFNTGNIKIRRGYKYTNENRLLLDMKLKPSINVGLARMTDKGPIIIASILFGHDQVRANRYFFIDEVGLVSFSLESKQRCDDDHDIVMVLETKNPTILGTIEWNKKWKASFAMKKHLMTLAPRPT